MKRIPFILGMVAVLFGGLLELHAQDMNALKASFKGRYAQLEALKKAGTAGETDAGLVEARGGDEAAKALVAAENADRQKLYELLSKSEKITPELVARRNAVRNRKKAKPGEYFKVKGAWVQVK